MSMAEGSIEEEELTAQRDAAVSLVRGLQEKIRAQAEELETRIEAAEMGRIEAEIELEHLRQEESGDARVARSQALTVTTGWLVGVILGWGAGFVMGCLFSPTLGFMLVPPFVSAGVVGGLVYSQLCDKMRSLRQDPHVEDHRDQQHHHHQQQDQVLGVEARGPKHKEEFLRQLQGRSDPSATYLHVGSDLSAYPSGSFLRRVATGAAHVLVRSALDATAAAAYSMLGLGGSVGAGAGARGGRAQGR